MAGVRRGPAPQPTELKRLRGNPGKRALPAPVVALTPVVASEVNDVPHTGGELVATILASRAAAWIGETDRTMLEMLGQAWDEREALRADVSVNGRSYMSESKVSGVQFHPRPEYQQLQAVEKQITTWLQLFGLTPTDRIRLGIEVGKAAKTNLELLRERARAHRQAGRQAS